MTLDRYLELLTGGRTPLLGETGTLYQGADMLVMLRPTYGGDRADRLDIALHQGRFWYWVRDVSKVDVPASLWEANIGGMIACHALGSFPCWVQAF